MAKFKGTKGELELKFVSGICIGIGTVGNPSQITANTVIYHIITDEDYAKEKEEIEANMKLYAAAPEMLKALKEYQRMYEDVQPAGGWQGVYEIGKMVIKKATK